MIDDATLVEWAETTTDYRLLSAIAEIRRLREEIAIYAHQQVESFREQALLLHRQHCEICSYAGPNLGPCQEAAAIRALEP